MINICSSATKSLIMRCIAAVLLIAMILSGLTACGSTEKTVKSEGMTITLSREYKKSTLANATWYYTSPDCIAMGIKSTKDDIEKSGLETNSVNDYAEAYIRANNIPGSPKVKTRGNYVYFRYSRKVKGTDYSYITCIYDYDDVFWMVSFACYKEMYKVYKNEFLASADSVTFTDDK